MLRFENHLGKRGENIATAELLTPGPSGVPWFNPHFLGDKTEAIDFYVEVVSSSRGEFFLAQVKTTTLLMEEGERRLAIRLSGSEYRRLASYIVPTYLFGVYAAPLSPEVYLLGVDRTRSRGITFFPTVFPLNAVTLEALHAEVCEYWHEQATIPLRSRFLR